jgi:hypothetical protein
MTLTRKTKSAAELLCATALSFGALATGAHAQNVGQPAGEEGKSNPLKNVYFGEQQARGVVGLPRPSSPHGR